MPFLYLCAMPLFIASLNSGSNGNCYYLGNDQDAVLVDAGLSCRITEKRMRKLGLSMESVRGIFISHEHTDHIKGAEVISRKHRIPVFISPATYLKSSIDLEQELFCPFNANEAVTLGGLTVHPLPKQHDGIDPYSFTVSHNGTTAGVFTDIGEPCANVIQHFKRCQAAFLEANYDETMLEQGHYPVYLKKRIRSEVGHLSNLQALELFNHHKSGDMQLLVLSHLSQHNNHPHIVQELFGSHAGGVQIVVASRHEESALFYVNEGK